MPRFNFDHIYFSPAITPKLESEYGTRIIEIFSGLRGRGTNFEKLNGLDLYSARGSDEVRFLCTRFNSTFVVIGVLEHHEYHKCESVYNDYIKSHAGAEQNLRKIDLQQKIELNVLSMNAPNLYGIRDRHEFSKIITLSVEQDEVLDKIEELQNLHPIFINGIAGTGKTTIAQYLLRAQIHGIKLLYVCPSENLAREQERQYNLIIAAEGLASTELPFIDFRSVRELYQEQGLITEGAILENEGSYQEWLKTIVVRKHARDSIKQFEKNPEQLYLEFKAMLSNCVRIDSGEEYENLADDLSSIPKEIRKTVFELYKSYLNYLSDHKIIVLELLPITEFVKKPYDRIITDELQLFSFTSIQQLIQFSDSPLIMFGDFNQGKFYFRFKKLTTILPGLQALSLSDNHRCSKPIIELSNSILELMRLYLGGEFEREIVTSLTHARKDEQADCGAHFVLEKDFVKIQLNPDEETVFIVDSQASKEAVLDKFGAGRVVLLGSQVPGLEFDNVIVYDFINKDYDELAKGLQTTSPDSKGSTYKPKEKAIAYSRLKDIGKFRDLFLMVTRARNSVYVVNKKSPFVIKLLEREALTECKIDSTGAAIRSKDELTSITSIVKLLNKTPSRHEGLRHLNLHVAKVNKDLQSDFDDITIPLFSVNFNFTEVAVNKLLSSTSKEELQNNVASFLSDYKKTPAVLARSTIQPGVDDEKIPKRLQGDINLAEFIIQHLKLMTFKSALKQNPSQSLYSILAGLNLTHKGNTYSDSKKIRTLLFNEFVFVGKSKAPAKSKSTKDSDQKTLANTTFLQKSYIDCTLSFSDAMRHEELTIIARVFNRPILLLDEQKTGADGVRFFNPGAPGECIVLNLNKDGFTKLSGKINIANIQKFIAQAGAKIHLSYLDTIKLQYGLALRDVSSDGHCLYHSIGAFTNKSVSELRDLAAQKISEISHIDTSLIEGDREEYLQGVRSDAWGGEVEIKVLSGILQRPIILFMERKVDLDKPKSELDKSKSELDKPIINVYSPHERGEPIFLHYDGINHYQYFDVADCSKTTFEQIQDEAVIKQRQSELPSASPKKAKEEKSASKPIGKQKITQSKSMQEQLIDAVYDGVFKNVKALVEKEKADVNQILPEGLFQGQTLIYIAASQGHSNIVEYLHSQGAELDKPLTDGFSSGKTPLFEAACSGHVNVIDFLASKGAVIDRLQGAGRSAGVTALYGATNSGQDLAVEKLIKLGANVNLLQQDGPDKGLSALFCAVLRRQIKTAILLIKEGNADVNLLQGEGKYLGRSPLVAAVAISDVSLLKILIQNGADIFKYLQVLDGTNPFLVSTTTGNIEVIKTLFNYAIQELNKRNESFSKLESIRSEVLKIAQEDKRTEVVKVLESYKVLSLQYSEKNRNEINYCLPTFFVNRHRLKKPHNQTKAGLNWYYASKTLSVSKDSVISNAHEESLNILKAFKKAHIKANTKSFIINCFFDSLIKESIKDRSDIQQDFDRHLRGGVRLIQAYMENMAENTQYSRQMILSVSSQEIHEDLKKINQILIDGKSFTRDFISSNVRDYNMRRTCVLLYESLQHLIKINHPVLENRDMSKVDQEFTEDRFNQIMAVFQSLSLHCYGLSIEEPEVSSSPQQLLEYLESNGPVIFSGKFGSKFYKVPFQDAGREVGGRNLYLWSTGNRKDVKAAHRVILTGIKINSADQEKSHIYFVDPDFSTSKIEESGKVFVMSYKLFCENLDRNVPAVKLLNFKLT